MLHLRFFTGLIAWKRIYGVLVLSPTSYYVEVDHSGHEPSLESFVQFSELILTSTIYLGPLCLQRERTLSKGS